MSVALLGSMLEMISRLKISEIVIVCVCWRRFCMLHRNSCSIIKIGSARLSDKQTTVKGQMHKTFQITKSISGRLDVCDDK
jgi:hypothetical protein